MAYRAAEHSLVCVGMSVYQQPLVWLHHAVNSVLRQSYSRWQLVIRADGETALAPEVLQWLHGISGSEPRITLHLGQERLGTFGSYGALFNQCKGDYLVQLDADDELTDNALERAVAALENSPSASYLYSSCELIDANGSRLGQDQRSLKPWSPQAELVQFIPFHLRMIRREAYERVGGYDGSYRYTGDYDLSLRLSELAPPVYLPEDLYRYRVHGGSESQQQRVATHYEAIRASRAAIERRGLKDHYALLHSSKHEQVSLRPRNMAPVVVAGMHRSGTSLVSRMLEKLNIDFGKTLIPADSDNPDGYQEDQDILSFQSAVFHAEDLDVVNGWPDWGWDPDRTVIALGRHHWRSTAQSLLQQRRPRDSAHSWGWKDPRSTLILPFWRELNQGLQVFGIYRAPWDISDALQRINHPEFRLKPKKILPLWSAYNRRLLEYQAAFPDETILIHAQQLHSASNRLPTLLNERWDFIATEPTASNDLNALIRADRLHTTALNDPIERLYQIAFPEVMHIWEQLQAEADWPATTTKEVPEVPRTATGADADEPLVSVIIPTYNPNHLLLEAIASVERYQPGTQTVELLIIDDGTNDPESLRLLECLAAENYRIIRQNNQGLAAARNTGFSHAMAPLVIPLDDDNRLLSPYLRELVPFMRSNPHVDVGYGDRLDFGAVHQRFQPGAINKAQMIAGNRIDACAVIRKDLWEKVGGYDTNLRALEDWDFWLSAGRVGIQSLYAAVPCFEYRVREESMLRNHLNNNTQHQTTMNYLRDKHRMPLRDLIQR